MRSALKIIMAILLLGCLLKVPYGYFQFIRIATCIGFAYLAYTELKENKSILGILSIACAILLNPIIKIHFTRKVWNQIDLILAIGLIIWVTIEFYYDRINKEKLDK